MTIRRAIPNLVSDDLAGAREFYAGFLGFDVAMHTG
jgi:catechol 2,3-dioxygenase-like lactoylglutathione lyase family enzyme